MYQQVKVKFSNVGQIQRFVNVIDKIDTDFDLGDGHRIVDAKSILGVMALDLSEPLPLRYYSEDENIKEKIAPFLFQGM